MSIKYFNRSTLRFLTDRLERLHQALQGLGLRLRESIAQMVGVQVGEAVQDAIEGLLNNQPARASPHRRLQQDRHLEHHYQQHDYRYGEPEEQGFWQEQEAFPHEPMPEDDQEAAPEQKPSRWKSLLVGAVELATWWIRCSPQRPSLKKVLCIGAIVGTATLTAGPLVAGALMAVGTAVLLTRLADNASHAVERLATVPVR